MHESATVLGALEAPEEIAAALREIGPLARLVHLGAGKWWLGVEKPNPKAQEILESGELQTGKVSALVDDPAARAMAQVQLEKEYTMYRIMADGFQPVALYDLDGRGESSEAIESLWEVVDDFRIRDHNWRNLSVGEKDRRVREHVSLDHRNRSHIARFGQLAADKARDAYEFIFRRRKSVVVDRNLE